MGEALKPSGPPVGPILNQTTAETERLARYDYDAEHANLVNNMRKPGYSPGVEGTSMLDFAQTNAELDRYKNPSTFNANQPTAGLLSDFFKQLVGKTAREKAAEAAAAGALANSNDNRDLDYKAALELDNAVANTKNSLVSSAWNALTSYASYQFSFFGTQDAAASTKASDPYKLGVDKNYDSVMQLRYETTMAKQDAAARTDDSYGASDWNKYIHVNPITLFPPNSLLINPMLPLDRFSGLLVRPFEPEFNQVKHTGNTGERYVADTRPLITPNTGIKGPSVMFQNDANFADEKKLIDHFNKHGPEFNAKSVEEYLEVGRYIMKNGEKVEYFYRAANENRIGYVQLMGTNSKGKAKFGFVGTNNDGAITTIHTEAGKNIWKTLNNDPKDQTIRPKK